MTNKKKEKLYTVKLSLRHILMAQEMASAGYEDLLKEADALPIPGPETSPEQAKALRDHKDLCIRNAGLYMLFYAAFAKAGQRALADVAKQVKPKQNTTEENKDV